MKIEPPRRAPEDEQRLNVLACLDAMGPCTELQLLQFLTEYDLMNYFEMMFALNDLCDRGQAARLQRQAGYLYMLTPAGKEALQLFGARTPKSLKKLLNENAAKWKQRFRQEAQSRQSIRQTQRGEYDLQLTVMEQDMDMMTLNLVVPTRELAQRLADHWPAKAARIYDTVIRILSEEEA